MKFLIIGGTGFIGSNVTKKLQALGHNVVVGAPETGVDVMTGEGLTKSLEGVEVVIDLSNAAAFDETTSVSFFKTAGNNLLTAEVSARTRHHVVLSIVGTDDMLTVPYMRAKKIQENIVQDSGVSYTIIRSTQFQQFVPTIANVATQGNQIHVSDVAFQPISAEEVAKFVTHFALSTPANGIVEIAGPDSGTMSSFVEAFVSGTHDPREVIENQKNEYLGSVIPKAALVPKGDAHLGSLHFADFISTLQSRH